MPLLFCARGDSLEIGYAQRDEIQTDQILIISDEMLHRANALQCAQC